MCKVITKVIETPIKCVVCLGSGENPADHHKVCNACDGDGVDVVIETTTETEKEQQGCLQGNPTVGDSLKWTTYYTVEYETCPTCGGSGRVPSLTYWNQIYSATDWYVNTEGANSFPSLYSSVDQPKNKAP